MKKDYKIYKIVNKINNKIYIGRTGFTLEKRFKEHWYGRNHFKTNDMYIDMKELSQLDFTIELIQDNLTYKQSIRREKIHIKKVFGDGCYNKVPRIKVEDEFNVDEYNKIFFTNYFKGL